MDDISGWDFYNHQNDPATVDTAYTPRQQPDEPGRGAGEQRPRRGRRLSALHVLPVKAGAEALDRTDDLAQAWLFAGRLRRRR